MSKIDFRGSEVKAALASYSMTQELMAQHINRVLASDYTTEYINKIILRKRSNRAVERVIWDLLGDWIEASRKIHVSNSELMVGNG